MREGGKRGEGCDKCREREESLSAVDQTFCPAFSQATLSPRASLSPRGHRIESQAQCISSCKWGLLLAAFTVISPNVCFVIHFYLPKELVYVGCDRF